jgi:sigma-B regulation protein RsbU (phosphoserine phosphatase)
VADGDLQTAVPSTGPPEVAELGESVERMRARLVRSLAESRRAVEALTQQGPAVIALRDALAPTVSTAAGLAVEGRLDPAEGVLAGDWFDVIDLSGGQVGVVLGDVAGHGPGPGVFALRLKHLISAALATGMGPGAALEWVVGQLGETGEMFATALVLVIDPSTGHIAYANAGHPEAVVVPAELLFAGSAALEATRTLPPTGPILNTLVAEPGGWTTRSASLASGEVLLAYTDGLVEARGTDGHELGLGGLLKCLPPRPEHREAASARQLLDDVFSIVSKHAGGAASDDRTALAITRPTVASAAPRPPRPASEPVTRPVESREHSPSASSPAPERVSVSNADQA